MTPICELIDDPIPNSPIIRIVWQIILRRINDEILEVKGILMKMAIKTATL